VGDRKLSNPADKEAAIDEVLPYVRAVRSRIQKREYFDIAMDSLRISDASLKRELWYSIRGGINQGDRLSQSAKRTTAKPTVAEQRLLELLFADPELRDAVLSMLQLEDYEDLATVEIFRALIAISQEGTEVEYESLIKKTEGDPVASELIPQLLMSDSWRWDSKETHAKTQNLTPEVCVQTFRLMKVENQIEEIKSELSDAARNGDADLVAELSRRQIELGGQRKTLRQIKEGESATL
jgi:hypothetical protein